MAGRGPNAIDIAHPIGETEPRLDKVRGWQRPRAICVRSSGDRRDGPSFASLTRLFVQAPSPCNPRIVCWRTYWNHQAAQPTTVPELSRRCLEALARPACGLRYRD